MSGTQDPVDEEEPEPDASGVTEELFPVWIVGGMKAGINLSDDNSSEEKCNHKQNVGAPSALAAAGSGWF